MLVKLEEDLTACGSLEEIPLPPLVLTQGVATETNTINSYQTAFFTILATDVLVAQKPFTHTIMRQNEAVCQAYDPAYVSLVA